MVNYDDNMAESYPEKWIWSCEQYPNFNFDIDIFSNQIDRLENTEKTLNTLISQLNDKNITDIKINMLCDEIINTSLIEDKVLQRNSVRSSIRKKLDESFDAYADKHSTRESDNLVEVFLDANNFVGDLNLEKLFGWHNALFGGIPYNGIYKIKLAEFRDGPVQVVSGVLGKEKVHYEGVPVKNINADMEKMLEFYNHSSLHPYIKSAIIHLWFAVIHPFDDGNGRLARILADSLLPKNDNSFAKFYTISTQINKEKKLYYDILEHTSSKILNPNLEINDFIKWHLDILEKSFKHSIEIIKNIIIKTNFWDNFKNLNLNERQKTAINKIFANNCEQILDIKKYKKISKSSLEEAKTDLDELLHLGCLVKYNEKEKFVLNIERDKFCNAQQQKFRINPRTGRREIIE